MKRFTEEQIIAVLREQEAGMKTGDSAFLQVPIQNAIGVDQVLQ